MVSYTEEQKIEFCNQIIRREKTVDEIAKETSRSHVSVVRWFRRAGLKYPDNNRFSREDVAEIISLARSGMFPDDIAKKTNRTKSGIVRLLTKHGVPFVYDTSKKKYNWNKIRLLYKQKVEEYEKTQLE